MNMKMAIDKLRNRALIQSPWKEPHLVMPYFKLAASRTVRH